MYQIAVRWKYAQKTVPPATCTVKEPLKNFFEETLLMDLMFSVNCLLAVKNLLSQIRQAVFKRCKSIVLHFYVNLPLCPFMSNMKSLFNIEKKQSLA